MKECPVCSSTRVKERRVNGVWAITCYACGYDSAEKVKDYHTHDREREREERSRERR